MHFVTPLFALIENPVMLAWLAAAAAPLVIHLLSKRRHRDAPWAAMEFLLRAMRASARRLWIEQWLLLAVRTAIVALVVFAIAKPVIESAAIGLGAGERALKILVIDNTMSMGHAPGGVARFDLAKESARRIVEEGRDGDAFLMLLMQDPPRVLIGSPAFDRSSVAKEIDSLTLRDGGGEADETLAELERLIESAKAEQPGLQRRVVYWITDLAKEGWRQEGARQSKQVEAARRVAKLAELAIVDVGANSEGNAAVIDIRASEPLVMTNRPVEFRVDVRAFGAVSSIKQNLEIWVDGQAVERQSLELTPGKETTASLTWRFASEGEHLVEARLEGDALPGDDRRFRVVRARQKVAVLCIDGEPNRRPRGTEFLMDALSLASGPEIAVEVASEAALVDRDLRRYDCLFLVNVARFTTRESEILRAYLRREGGIVYFLGDAVQSDSYNELLAQVDDKGLRAAPALVGERVANVSAAIDPLGFKHPLLAAFRGQNNSAFLGVSVSEYFRLSPPAEGEARVALATSNGDPLVVESAAGRGRVAMVATTADARWTTLPLTPAYVPLIQELLALTASASAEERTVQVGEPISGQLMGTTAADSVSLSLPGGESAAPSLDIVADRWTFSDTDRAGVYRASFTGSEIAPQVFAANPYTRESDLARLTRDDFMREVWPGVDVRYLTDPITADDGALSGSPGRRALYRWLLLAVLALLLIETGLAARLGRRFA